MNTAHSQTSHNHCHAHEQCSTTTASSQCYPSLINNHKHKITSSWKEAGYVTLHCLAGCALGEWGGLTLGVLLQLQPSQTILLAVFFAYISGFGLALWPLLRKGVLLRQAFRAIWLGEMVSIATMELVMNIVDYYMGGMNQGMSLLHAQYWIAFCVAAASGYLAAWPVNFWMLRNQLKKPCH